MPDPLLVEILAELRGLRQDLAARSKPGPNEAVADLLHAIVAYCGDATFSARALVVHAGQSPSLRAAILAIIDVLNARLLGKALQRFEGMPIDGLQIQRVGADSAGALWTVARVS